MSGWPHVRGSAKGIPDIAEGLWGDKATEPSGQIVTSFICS